MQVFKGIQFLIFWLNFVVFFKNSVMIFLTNTQSICTVRWASYPPGPSSFSLFVSSLNTSFLPLLPAPPSILFIPVFKLNTLLGSREEGWCQVKGDYLFFSPQAQTACSLWWSFTTCMHYVLSVFSFSFPICLTWFSFLSIFCHHNLPHFWPGFFLFYFHPFCFFSFFYVFLFFFFFSPPIPFPVLPHRSGCSCGTQQGRSDFVASSQVTSETLLLLS